MLDEKFFTRLSGLSKFDFSEGAQERFLQDLNAIIGFVGKVREFEGEYDDIAEGKQIAYSDLREDVAISTATPEQLLANTNSGNDCYVIPKVID